MGNATDQDKSMERARKEYDALAKKDLKESYLDEEASGKLKEEISENGEVEEYIQWLDNEGRKEEEAERRKRQEAIEARDISMEMGAIIAAIIFIVSIHGARWALSSESISGLIRLLLQFATIAASAVSCCALAALFFGSFTDILTILGGIAGLIGGVVTITLYEYPDIYQKIVFVVLAVAVLMVIKIIIKRARPMPV